MYGPQIKLQVYKLNLTHTFEINNIKLIGNKLLCFRGCIVQIRFASFFVVTFKKATLAGIQAIKGNTPLRTQTVTLHCPSLVCIKLNVHQCFTVHEKHFVCDQQLPTLHRSHRVFFMYVTQSCNPGSSIW